MTPQDPPSSPVVRSPMVVALPGFGVSVFESRHGPGFFGQLRDEFSKFFLVLAGRAVWESESGRVLLGADSFVHVPAGLEHRQVDVEGNAVTLYAIHYQPGLLLGGVAARLKSLGLAHWPASEGGVTRFLRGCFQEMLYEQHLQREGWETLLTARLLEISARFVRLLERHGEAPELGSPRDWSAAERVAQYVQLQKTRFFRQETLDDAARSVGLSRRQFTALFREVAGQSWLEHRTLLRLQHALQLLARTENSVIAIAFEAGFEDLSNFNRAFKLAYGFSPKAYRDTVRAPGPDSRA